MRVLNDAATHPDAFESPVQAERLNRPTPEARPEPNRDPDRFIGRAFALTELRSSLEAARGGRGQLTLLAGEPGIGKTRTAEELIELARSRNVAVHLARCQESGGAPPFWPWIQILRSLMRDASDRSGSSLAELREIIPELTAATPMLPATPESDHSRFQLFDGVTAYFKEISGETPHLLFFDDLQWADPTTLNLMQFFSNNLAGCKILLLGAYRDLELADPDPRAALLDSLRRGPFSHEIVLRGLNAHETSDLVTNSMGHSLPADLMGRIHQKTDGNPFFIGEIVRMIGSDAKLGFSGDPSTWKITLPRGVREVIRRRFRNLSAGCMQVLSASSVIGREFNLNVLERLVDLDADSLLHAMDESLQAQVIGEVDGIPGRYRFAHASIREILYEDLSTVARLNLHCRIGGVIEAQADTAQDESLAELAYHFFQAAPLGDARKAVDYAQHAAQAAVRMLAYEEAVEQYNHALQALDWIEGASEIERAELYLSLGQAAELSGAHNRARESFNRASEIAKRCSAPELVGRAALGLGEVTFDYEIVDQAMIADLEYALDILPSGSRALRAKLMARLGVAVSFLRDPDRAHALGRQAIAIARELGDPGVLAYTLAQRQWTNSRPEQLKERMQGANELLELATRAGDPLLALSGRVWRLCAQLDSGDIAAVDREFQALDSQARELRHPSFLVWASRFEVVRALIDGRFDAAEQLAMRTYELSKRLWPRAALQGLTAQLFFVRREQGRLAELQESVRSAVSEHPTIPGWRCGLAFVESELDHREATRSEFERLASNDFHELCDDRNGLFSLPLIAEVCAYLGDSERAATLYRLLEPFSGMNAGPGFGIVSLGSINHYLGRLATLMDQWDVAEEQFARALEMHTRMGARPWLADTQVCFAEMLRARRGDGDLERAEVLMARARETAEELNMARLLRRMTPARAPVVSTVAKADRASCGFVKEGDYWTIDFAGATARLKDQVGLNYVAELLHHPGEEFHATVLLASARGHAAAPSGTPAGDAGPLLDTRAKLAYRSRLRELREELEEANEFNDLERSSKIQAEIDALVKELSRAIGLGGRDRKAASVSERARVNVTRRIRIALRNIAKAIPKLGDHLNATVKTGTFISYNPDPRIPIDWRF